MIRRGDLAEGRLVADALGLEQRLVKVEQGFAQLREPFAGACWFLAGLNDVFFYFHVATYTGSYFLRQNILGQLFTTLSG